MTTRSRLVGVALAVAVWTTAAVPADPPARPITEIDLLKLIELKIPDEVIAKRVETGVEFPADEAIFTRLKKAGASDTVVAAVKKVAKPAPATVVALWVKRNYGWDNGLHSELTINGKPLGKFTSDTDRSIGEHLKTGWNTIELKTNPVAGATENNHLIFRIGSVRKKKDSQRVMDVLWEFENGT